jgi:hypothetical protein
VHCRRRATSASILLEDPNGTTGLGYYMKELIRSFSCLRHVVILPGDGTAKSSIYSNKKGESCIS